MSCKIILQMIYIYIAELPPQFLFFFLPSSDLEKLPVVELTLKVQSHTHKTQVTETSTTQRNGFTPGTIILPFV